MGPDTPERFPFAASARCTWQDQTRFGGSAERILQLARQRPSPLPLSRKAGRGRRKAPEFGQSRRTGAAAISFGSSLDCQRRPGRSRLPDGTSLAVPPGRRDQIVMPAGSVQSIIIFSTQG